MWKIFIALIILICLFFIHPAIGIIAICGLLLWAGASNS